MEGGGGGGLYTYCYTVTTRIIPADESHFNVSVGSDGQSHKSPQTTTFLKRKESRSGIELRSFRLPAQRLTARPNRSQSRVALRVSFVAVHSHVVWIATELFGIRGRWSTQCLPLGCILNKPVALLYLLLSVWSAINLLPVSYCSAFGRR